MSGLYINYGSVNSSNMKQATRKKTLIRNDKTALTIKLNC